MRWLSITLGALAALSPEAFATQELTQKLGAAHVVAGFDFHFGAGRKGNAGTLRQLGFTVTTLSEVTDEGAGHLAFSSSSVRNARRRLSRYVRARPS